MNWIDAHSHIPLDIPDAAAWWAELGIDAAMNICVAHDDLGKLVEQRAWYRALAKFEPEKWAWATSFSLEGFGSAGWVQQAISQIRRDCEAGRGHATGCKVWKNVGMELRDPVSGAFVFVDDERFAPVFEWLQMAGRPLLMHIAEPIQAWRPLNPRDPHYAYFSNTKKWHWHGRPEVPSHERLIASRDAIIARYPKLPVIGLHFGSQEHDLKAVGERLARWPNYHIDTAARFGDLIVHAEHDREALIAFFDLWQDRILWGVDFAVTHPISLYSEEERAKLRAAMSYQFGLERAFFETDQEMTILGRTVRGLNLRRDVLQKVVRGNARRMYWR